MRDAEARPLTAAELRRLVRALHRTLRDGEGNSSLIERFDELTKVLYCKVMDERRAAGASAFTAPPGETDRQVSARLHAFFAGLVGRQPRLFPPRFATLRLSD